MTGTVGLAAAVVVVVAVGLLPLPSWSITPPSSTVTPIPADELRLCPGGLLRLGDATGQNAATPSSVGAPSVRAESVGAELGRAQLAKSDADTGRTSAAPTTLTITPEAGALLSGAQSQTASDDDISGFAAASCAEPSGSAWLVGGSSALGRTTVLTLANPTAVDAVVVLTILGEKGPVVAPGLSGIVVAAGTQRVIRWPASPGCRFAGRPRRRPRRTGRRLAAAVDGRGLDPGGVELIGAAADPSDHLLIPGLRVFDAASLSKALGLSDWDDASPVVRLAVPGSVAAKVQVSLVPEAAGGKGASFDVSIPAGQAVDTPLDAGVETDSGELTIPDGQYSVVVESDQPVVGAVRLSTSVDPGDDGSAPASDFAWYAAAPVLGGTTLVTVASGPGPRIGFANPGAAAVTVTLHAIGGAPDATVSVPAHGAASLTVASGSSYTLSGADGLSAAVGYAGDAALSSYPIASPRAVSAPIVIHP